MTPKAFFQAVRRALKVSQHDYTQGDIAEAVVLLAVPMILELALESVFAIVDMFFVSRLGENAIATVGLTESLVSIVYSVAIGLSAGATAIVARRIGAKQREAAANAAFQSLIVAVGASLLISACGFFYAGPALALMGANAQLVREGAIFAQILLSGNLAILLLFVINGLFRGAGDAAMAMRSLWVASIANILLCPLLIPAFGLRGAAIATVVGRSCGVVYQLFHLFNGKSELDLARRHLRLQFDVVLHVLEVAWPATFQFLIGSGGWIILTRFIAETGGTAASAGYQVAIRCFIFFMLPAWGLSNAAATLVGQNLGAKEPWRAERSVMVTTKYSAVAMAIVTVFFVLFAPQVVREFTSDPPVYDFAVQSLRILSLGYIFFGVGMVLTQALNGAGDTRTPTWLNFVCFWLVQNPLAYILAKPVGLGSIGIVWSVPIAQVLLVVLAYIVFRRGRWKTVEV